MRDEPLSRAAVVAAAVELAGEQGLDNLSSRALADRLKVTPMALYRHVRDMDELVGAVVDRRLAELGLPPGGQRWDRWLEEFAQGLRDLFRQEPGALALFTRQPVTTVSARARLERAVAVLEASGFDTAGAAAAYGAVHTFTVGFCALEAGRRRAPDPVDADGVNDPSSARIRGFVTDDGFIHGLRALISGLDPTR